MWQVWDCKCAGNQGLGCVNVRGVQRDWDICLECDLGIVSAACTLLRDVCAGHPESD